LARFAGGSAASANADRAAGDEGFGAIVTLAPERSYLLAVEGLTVSFDGFRAVDDLSFYIDKKELRAIIGPNGAGKTTVLDLISGRTRADSGSVLFKGEELSRLREHEIVRRGIGRKFQTPSVYESLTVFENLEMSYPKGRTAFGAWWFTRTPDVIRRVEEIAEVVELSSQLGDAAELLSHGQKQWLEIGMLLIQDPLLMMLDEPVAGMSVAEREKTAQLLQRICKDCAVIVVEHDMDFVRSIAHRVTVLHQGKWLAEGSMDKVQNDPKVIEVYLGH
jgi:urea transport system ATP-binding protein